MTITYEEIGGESGQPRASTQDETWARTYVRYFRAITDDPTIGPGAVRAGCGVTIGTPYSAYGETDAGAYAQRISAVEDTSAEDGIQWVVTVEYGPYNAILLRPEDPLIMTPRIQFTSTRFQAIPTLDVDGFPATNSADDPFIDPPLTIDSSRPFMTIQRNESSFSPLLAHDYKDSINDATWFGMPQYTWKCLDITADEAIDPNGAYYWIVTYQFELNPDTWRVPVLDVGLRYIDTGSGKKIRILDDDYQPVTTPWPLNSDGSRKASGSPADEMRLHLYKELDFTTFNLDTFYNDLITSGRLT